MKHKLTISDIASKFGVSVTTISFILNGKGHERRISPSLIRRVEEFVKKSGYAPNSVKRKLKSAQINLVALLTSSNESLDHLSWFSAFEKSLAVINYSLIIVRVSDGKEEETVKHLMDHGVEFFVSIKVLDEDLVEKIHKNDRFLMSIGNTTTSQIGIGYNYKSTAVELVKSLFAVGAKRVGCVTSQHSTNDLKECLDGYMQAVDAEGADLLIKKLNVELLDSDLIAEIQQFIDGNRLDAVFYTQEYYALLGAQALRRGELQLTGVSAFGRYDLLSLVYPQLTQVASYPNIALADALVEMIQHYKAQKKAKLTSRQLFFELYPDHARGSILQE